MGRVCMGRVGYGPSLSWAEFVMGRDVQLPILNMDISRNSYKITTWVRLCILCDPFKLDSYIFKVDI